MAQAAETVDDQTRGPVPGVLGHPSVRPRRRDQEGPPERQHPPGAEKEEGFGPLGLTLAREPRPQIPDAGLDQEVIPRELGLEDRQGGFQMSPGRLPLSVHQEGPPLLSEPIQDLVTTPTSHGPETPDGKEPSEGPAEWRVRRAVPLNRARARPGAPR
jgi:hypothetical protein